MVPEKTHETAPKPEVHTPTEEMVCMRMTVPHHIDNSGTSLEEKAGGTGECETLGG